MNETYFSFCFIDIDNAMNMNNIKCYRIIKLNESIIKSTHLHLSAEKQCGVIVQTIEKMTCRYIVRLGEKSGKGEVNTFN